MSRSFIHLKKRISASFCSPKFILNLLRIIPLRNILSIGLLSQTLAYSADHDHLSYSAYVDISTQYEYQSNDITALNFIRSYDHYHVNVDQNMNILNMGYGTLIELAAGTEEFNTTYGETNYMKTITWDANLSNIIVTKFGLENGIVLNGIPAQGTINDIPETSIAFFDNHSVSSENAIHTISKSYSFNLDATPSLANWAHSIDGSVYRGIIFDYSEVLEVTITTNSDSFVIANVNSGQKNGWDYPLKITQTTNPSTNTLQKTTDCNGKTGFFISAPYTASNNTTALYDYEINLDSQNPNALPILSNYSPVISWRFATHTPLSFNTPPPSNGSSVTNNSAIITHQINQKFLSGFTALSTDLDQCTPMPPGGNWNLIDSTDHVNWWISAKLEIEGSQNGNLAFYSHNNLDDGLYSEIFTIEELVMFSNKISSDYAGDDFIIVNSITIPDISYNGAIRNAHTFSTKNGKFTILDTGASDKVMLHEYFHVNHSAPHRPHLTQDITNALLNNLPTHGNELNAFEWIAIGENSFKRN